MAQRLQVGDERTDPLQRFATGRRLRAERERAEPLLRLAKVRRLQAGRERDYLLTDLQNGGICRQCVNKPNPCSVLRQSLYPTAVRPSVSVSLAVAPMGEGACIFGCAA